MIDLQMIEHEISCLEQEDTTYDVCEQLATLYVVRDHLKLQKVDAPVKSDFMAAVEGVDRDALLRILDTHMQGVKVVFPKEYEKVMSQIGALK